MPIPDGHDAPAHKLDPFPRTCDACGNFIEKGGSFWQRLNGTWAAIAAICAIAASGWVASASMSAKADGKSVDALDGRIQKVEIAIPVLTQAVKDIDDQVRYTRMDFHEYTHGHHAGDPVAPPVVPPSPIKTTEVR